MNFFIFVVFIILEKVIPLFPIGFIYFIVRIKAQIFYYLVPIRRKVAHINLKMAFPEKDDKEIRKIIKKCYLNVLIVIAEFFYLPGMNSKKLSKKFVIINQHEMKQKLDKGNGIIFVSGHFGNWEIMAFGGSVIFGKPICVITKEQSNKPLDKRINYMRSFKGNIMIDMKNAAKDVLKSLGKNYIVAMLSDQSAPAESVKVKFFGQDITAFEGPAVFALKTGAPLFWGVPVRDGKYNYSLKAIEIDTSVYKDYSLDYVKEITQKITALLEQHVREHPDHWLWFHRRFKSVISYD